MHLKAVILVVVLFLTVSCASSISNNNKTGSGGGMVISSISEIATIPVAYARMVVCRGNYAYLYGRNGTGFISNFVIYDLSNPASPVMRGFLTNAGSGWGLALNGNYAYLQSDGAGTNMFTNGGNFIVDISDPDNPKEVQGTRNGYASGYQNYFYNGYLYTFSWVALGVFNMSNPSNFNYVTNITNLAVVDYEWGAFSNNYLFLNSDNRFEVYSISNPAAFSIVSSITCANTSSGGCVIRGNYAYVTGTATNIYVIDISNPASPVVVNNYTVTDIPILNGKLYDIKSLGDYILMVGKSVFMAIKVTDSTNLSYAASVNLTSTYVWNFDILNDRYAVVGDYSNYHVFQLY